VIKAEALELCDGWWDGAFDGLRVEKGGGGGGGGGEEEGGGGGGGKKKEKKKN